MQRMGGCCNCVSSVGRCFYGIFCGSTYSCICMAILIVVILTLLVVVKLFQWDIDLGLDKIGLQN